ncbi:MAG: NfeD family protein [Pseudoclavibacter sp.]|nr:NfeD family protein [Pseudoclavibacter sp.]
MTVFLILGAIGLALLLFSLVFGDVFDVDGGFLSLPGVGVALVVFGASGAITVSTGLPGVWVYIVSALVGMAAYAVAALAIRSLQRSSDGEPREVAGETGVATSRITPSSGEVSIAGEVERRLAFSETEIEQGARIRVVRQHGARVEVEAIPAGGS